MLQVRSFIFNPFSENTYVLINDKKQCWIVDPGMYDARETNSLTGWIEREGLIPHGIINTHAHIDHILGVQAVTDAYGIPFSLHEADMPVLKGARGAAMMFGMNLASVPVPSGFIQEGVPLMLGDEAVEVRFTPGHSPGSIVFYYAPGKWLIGGDVLFSGSIGRTDLPGGHYDTLIRSIREQVFTLPDDTVVYPGHGPSTTIGEEKASNPFLQ